MILKNEDIKEVVVEIPEGHKHLKTTLRFTNGKEVTFQEATIANIVRVFTTVKTYPTRIKVCLGGKAFKERKDGYAEWQITEKDELS